MWLYRMNSTGARLRGELEKETGKETTPLLAHKQIEHEQSMEELDARVPRVCGGQRQRKSSSMELDFAAGAEKETGKDPLRCSQTTKSSATSRQGSSTLESLRYLEVSSARKSPPAGQIREREGREVNGELHLCLVLIGRCVLSGRDTRTRSLRTARWRSDDARNGAPCKDEMVPAHVIDFA